MTSIKYPDGLDIFWAAIDEAGNIGVFLSGGIGPIPAAVLGRLDLAELDDAFTALPDVSDVEIIAPTAVSERFETLGRKGAYVFDWTDLHRINGYLYAYEKLVVPKQSIAFDQLPVLLRNAVESVRFEDASFERSPTLRPQDFFDCPRPRLIT